MIHNVTVSIQIDGNPMQEFPAPRGEGNPETSTLDNREWGPADRSTALTAGMPYRDTKYIEAVSGAFFSIHIAMAECAKAVADIFRIKIYVDGSYAAWKTLSSLDRRAEDGFWSRLIRGSSEYTENVKSMKPFYFAELSIGKFACESGFNADLLSVEASRSDPMNLHDLSKLGLIEVELWRQKRIGTPSRRRTVRPNRHTPQNNQKVDESTVKGKGLSHKRKSYSNTLQDNLEVDEKTIKGKGLTHNVRYLAQTPKK